MSRRFLGLVAIATLFTFLVVDSADAGRRRCRRARRVKCCTTSCAAPCDNGCNTCAAPCDNGCNSCAAPCGRRGRCGKSCAAPCGSSCNACAAPCNSCQAPCGSSCTTGACSTGGSSYADPGTKVEEAPAPPEEKAPAPKKKSA